MSLLVCESLPFGFCTFDIHAMLELLLDIRRSSRTNTVVRGSANLASNNVKHTLYYIYYDTYICRGYTRDCLLHSLMTGHQHPSPGANIRRASRYQVTRVKVVVTCGHLCISTSSIIQRSIINHGSLSLTSFYEIEASRPEL